MSPMPKRSRKTTNATKRSANNRKPAETGSSSTAPRNPHSEKRRHDRADPPGMTVKRTVKRKVSAERSKPSSDTQPVSPEFRWTPARIKLLGTVSDQKLAAKLKIGTTTVYKKRRELDIAPFGRSYKEDSHQWTPSEIRKLGQESDQKVAATLGISVSTVATKRRQLKIPSIRQRRGQKLGREPRTWRASELKLLGKHTDAWIAKKLKMGRRHVYAKRLELGIPSSTEQKSNKMWTDRRLKMLGKVPDKKLADEIGVTVATVSNRRQSMGIESYRDQRRSQRAAKRAATKKSTKISQPKPAEKPRDVKKTVQPSQKKSAAKDKLSRPRRGK